MSRLVDQPDVSMGLESASSSDDFEDEDDDHVLDNVEAGLAEAARPPKSTMARKVYSIDNTNMLRTVVNNNNSYHYTTVVALYNMIRNNIRSLVILLNYNILFRHVRFCVAKEGIRKRICCKTWRSGEAIYYFDHMTQQSTNINTQVGVVVVGAVILK